MQPNPHETIEFLASTWPKCFRVKLRERVPLKVGMGQDLAAAAAGAITDEEISVAMRVYVGNKRYLKALREGAVRFDLDGNPAGVVTPNEAAHARHRIDRIDARASAGTRARGLAIRDAKIAAEEQQRTAEVAAGRRKPLLRMPRRGAAIAALQAM
jgi:ProP effector